MNYSNNNQPFDIADQDLIRIIRNKCLGFRATNGDIKMTWVYFRVYSACVIS